MTLVHPEFKLLYEHNQEEEMMLDNYDMEQQRK